MKRAAFIGLFGVIAVTLLGGYIWLFENIEDPEADIKPLAIVSNADAVMLESIKLELPATDGVRVTLTSAQVRALIGHLARRVQSPKLTNRSGYQYIFSVKREKDKLAPHGYVYDWSILDVGRDGKPGTSDDVGAGWAGRP